VIHRLELSDALYEYLHSVSMREPEILARLREETSRIPMAEMQIPPEQGQFLHLLVQLVRARQTLEVGVFTGYSTLWTALALPADGRVVACDVSEEWTSVARRYWKEAGVDGRIDLHLRPALETLNHLLERGKEGSFDFAFIDGDKPNLRNYYELVLRLLRPGGLIAIDNVLRSGEVIDTQNTEEGTVAMRDLNRALHLDQRVTLSMLPVADGITLAMKR
jgi:predicted O-methyltransferase YrrM